MAEPESPLVKLAGAIGGASAGIFFLAAFFGGHDLWPAAVAVIALAAMGFGFAYLITKPR
jgi:VIT1/CCC1 family predicted Fe2+/Mn2+ transporter